MSIANFSVSGASIHATGLAARARQFTVLVDEPEELGGKDYAPNPVEYILLGYAGCLNVVLNLVAKEKGITINDLQIEVGGNINIERFLGVSFKERAGFNGFDVRVSIDSDARPDEVAELLREAKERCPVNDNLANGAPIEYSYSITKSEINSLTDKER